MPNGTEKKALEAMYELGGKADIRTVSRHISVDTNYARLLCNALGRADYIDIDRTGLCVLAPKGKSELKAMGKWKVAEGDSETRPDPMDVDIQERIDAYQKKHRAS